MNLFLMNCPLLSPLFYSILRIFFAIIFAIIQIVATFYAVRHRIPAVAPNI
jgi:hypothetical protein